MTAIERIEKMSGTWEICDFDDGEFLLTAFRVMKGIAHEMADMASGGNGDYETIDQMFEERMK